MANRIWSRSELIIAFYQYCITPFGKMHHRNPDIIELAAKLNRTPDAVAMKMLNFAKFDPVQQARGISGLSNASKADERISKEFTDNWDALLEELGQLSEDFEINWQLDDIDDELKIPEITEIQKVVKIRVAQSFFRKSILANYKYNCAICQIDNPKLLNASHIIPWSVNEQRRADPQNGISLCALHDRAFDRGLLTLDSDYAIVLSNSLHRKTVSELHDIAFVKMEGQQILLPDKFAPDQKALDYHRKYIFKS